MRTRYSRLLCLPLLATAAWASDLHLDRGQSRVEISVKSTIDSFVAEATAFDARVSLGPSAAIEAAEVRVPFSAIRTGKEDRDRDMNAWQGTARFPDVVFTLTALEPSTGAGNTAVGRLRLHGVERAVRIPVSLRAVSGTWVIDGEASLDTREYGLPVITKLLVLKVDPVVKVRFHLVEAP